jgi:hypothetical protein
LRRYGVPSAVRVVSAFAMLLAIASIRTRCAERPLAEIPRVRNIGRTIGRYGSGGKPA